MAIEATFEGRKKQKKLKKAAEKAAAAAAQKEKKAATAAAKAAAKATRDAKQAKRLADVIRPIRGAVVVPDGPGGLAPFRRIEFLQDDDEVEVVPLIPITPVDGRRGMYEYGYYPLAYEMDAAHVYAVLSGYGTRNVRGSRLACFLHGAAIETHGRERIITAFPANAEIPPDLAVTPRVIRAYIGQGRITHLARPVGSTNQSACVVPLNKSAAAGIADLPDDTYGNVDTVTVSPIPVNHSNERGPQHHAIGEFVRIAMMPAPPAITVPFVRVKLTFPAFPSTALAAVFRANETSRDIPLMEYLFDGRGDHGMIRVHASMSKKATNALRAQWTDRTTATDALFVAVREPRCTCEIHASGDVFVSLRDVDDAFMTRVVECIEYVRRTLLADTPVADAVKPTADANRLARSATLDVTVTVPRTEFAEGETSVVAWLNGSSGYVQAPLARGRFRQESSRAEMKRAATRSGADAATADNIVARAFRGGPAVPVAYPDERHAPPPADIVPIHEAADVPIDADMDAMDALLAFQGGAPPATATATATATAKVKDSAARDAAMCGMKIRVSRETNQVTLEGPCDMCSFALAVRIAAHAPCMPNMDAPEFVVSNAMAVRELHALRPDLNGRKRSRYNHLCTQNRRPVIHTTAPTGVLPTDTTKILEFNEGGKVFYADCRSRAKHHYPRVSRNGTLLPCCFKLPEIKHDPDETRRAKRTKYLAEYAAENPRQLGPPRFFRADMTRAAAARLPPVVAAFFPRKYEAETQHIGVVLRRRVPSFTQVVNTIVPGRLEAVMEYMTPRRMMSCNGGAFIGEFGNHENSVPRAVANWRTRTEEEPEPALLWDILTYPDNANRVVRGGFNLVMFVDKATRIMCPTSHGGIARFDPRLPTVVVLWNEDDDSFDMVFERRIPIAEPRSPAKPKKRKMRKAPAARATADRATVLNQSYEDSDDEDDSDYVGSDDDDDDDDDENQTGGAGIIRRNKHITDVDHYVFSPGTLTGKFLNDALQAELGTTSCMTHESPSAIFLSALIETGDAYQVLYDTTYRAVQVSFETIGFSLPRLAIPPSTTVMFPMEGGFPPATWAITQPVAEQLVNRGIVESYVQVVDDENRVIGLAVHLPNSEVDIFVPTTDNADQSLPDAVNINKLNAEIPPIRPGPVQTPHRLRNAQYLVFTNSMRIVARRFEYLEALKAHIRADRRDGLRNDLDELVRRCVLLVAHEADHLRMCINSAGMALQRAPDNSCDDEGRLKLTAKTSEDFLARLLDDLMNNARMRDYFFNQKIAPLLHEIRPGDNERVMHIAQLRPRK